MASTSSCSIDDSSLHARPFVVLMHDHPFLHWDFFIAEDGGLAGWRLLQRPAVGISTAAVPLPPHRTHYLTWEGPVSGGRGQVSQEYSGRLLLSHPWPALSDWTGLCFRIEATGLGASCRLTRGDEGSDRWEFLP